MKEGDIITRHEAESVLPATEQVGIIDPSKIVEIAKKVSQYVESQNLSVVIQGNKYVMVEGWQFAGVLIGLHVVTDSVTDISPKPPVQKTWKWTQKYGSRSVEKTYTSDVWEFEAVAELKDVNGNVRARGFASCTNDEHGKHEFNKNAVRSMAQTRAIGKAGRSSLAWLIKAAGYNPTPAEEMQEVQEIEQNPPAEMKIKELPEDVQFEIDAATDYKHLRKWADQMTDYKGNQVFLQAVYKRLKELGDPKILRHGQ